MEIWLLIGGVTFIWLLWKGFRNSSDNSSTTRTPSSNEPPSFTVKVTCSNGQEFDSSLLHTKQERKGQPGRWVPPGETVTVHGYSIPRGMVYLGKWLPPVKDGAYSHQKEPSILKSPIGDP